MRPGDVFPESGNRLPRLERDALDEAGRTLFDEAAGGGATVKGPQGILLRSSRLYGLLREVNRFLRTEIGLDARLRELMILVTARELGAHHEWQAHAIIAKREGLEDEIIDIVLHRKRLRGLGEQERVIIKLGRDTIRKQHVGRATYAKALELFGAETLVNLTALMGQYAAMAMMLTVFAQELPDGAKSALDSQRKRHE